MVGVYLAKAYIFQLIYIIEKDKVIIFSTNAARE